MYSRVPEEELGLEAGPNAATEVPEALVQVFANLHQGRSELSSSGWGKVKMMSALSNHMRDSKQSVKSRKILRFLEPVAGISLRSFQFRPIRPMGAGLWSRTPCPKKPILQKPELRLLAPKVGLMPYLSQKYNCCAAVDLPCFAQSSACVPFRGRQDHPPVQRQVHHQVSEACVMPRRPQIHPQPCEVQELQVAGAGAQSRALGQGAQIALPEERPRRPGKDRRSAKHSAA